MRYPHIMAAVRSEVWAMEETKFLAMMEFLELQFAGGKFTGEELEARIGKGQEKSVARQEGGVRIIPIRGTIVNRASLMSDISGGVSSERIGNDVQAALEEKDVKAIVLDVDSPGGQVQGTDELSSAIYAARGTKPIVAHVNANAASAAYWIATAADEMVLTPSAEVGSVGVLGVYHDDSGMREKMGIARTVISAGKYKAELAGGPLSDEARAYQQSRVDEAYGAFVKALARNRNVTQAQVRDGFGEGRMVPAATAIKAGMADSIGTLSDVLARFGTTPAKAFAFEREKRALAL